MKELSTVTKLQVVTSEISLMNIPENRYGFKFIGIHVVARKLWSGDFSELTLGAVTSTTKLEEVIRGYEGFPVLNINILPVIEARLDDIPEPWLGKTIYIIGTTFAPIDGKESVISFKVTNCQDSGDRKIEKIPHPITKGAEIKSRALLFKE